MDLSDPSLASSTTNAPACSSGSGGGGTGPATAPASPAPTQVPVATFYKCLGATCMALTSQDVQNGRSGAPVAEFFCGSCYVAPTPLPTFYVAPTPLPVFWTQSPTATPSWPERATQAPTWLSGSTAAPGSGYIVSPPSTVACGAYVDAQSSCVGWAAQGQCTGSSAAWMAANCARSCCSLAAPATAAPRLWTAAPTSPAVTVAPRPVTTPSCLGTDSQAMCVTWAAQGQCTGASASWMAANCARSCSSACNSQPATPAPIV